MATPTDNLPAGLRGLTDAEADRRRDAGQGNDVEIRAGRTYGRIVRDNVFNFINNLFYFLGILLLILGKPLDAFAVVFVIGANTVISLFQEIRAKRVMDKMAILLRPKADVVRDGELREIDPAQVVLGDLLRVQPGDQVVVDGPMVGEGRMEVDESLLTGESDLVTKHPGDELMSGSFCMTGGGYYEADKVGLDSFANKLTAKAKVFKRELTPLQRQVVQIVRVLLIVVIVFETLVWVRNVARRRAVRGERAHVDGDPGAHPQRAGAEHRPHVRARCGAAARQGRAGAAGQRRGEPEQRRRALHRQDGDADLRRDRLRGAGAAGRRRSARAARLLGAFAASTTDANRTIEALRTAFPARAPDAPRTRPSSRRTVSGAASPSTDGDTRGTYVLGAPEMLAPALARRRRLAGRRPTTGRRAGCASCSSPGAAEPLAFSADPDAAASCPPASRRSPSSAFSDELRPGVRQTLEEFSEAGIEVKMISGDNPQTVVALATQAGVQSLHRRQRASTRYCETTCRRRGERSRPTSPATTGGRAGARRTARSSPSPAPSSRACPPEEFAAAADEASIFGRVTPEQKQDLVEALRDRGRYVAMIGDGVNDVIALKQANVAVAMQGGSQAARGVGDLILMNDTFAPLPYAFREGQRIINGMNDILRIFMVRIFFKASIIAIVTGARRLPVRPAPVVAALVLRRQRPGGRPSRSGRSRARRPR